MGSAAAVRERPNLFLCEMVGPILDGRETRTRRVLTPQPDGSLAHTPGEVANFLCTGTGVRTGREVFMARDAAHHLV